MWTYEHQTERRCPVYPESALKMFLSEWKWRTFLWWTLLCVQHYSRGQTSRESDLWFIIHASILFKRCDLKQMKLIRSAGLITLKCCNYQSLSSARAHRWWEMIIISVWIEETHTWSMWLKGLDERLTSRTAERKHWRSWTWFSRTADLKLSHQTLSSFTTFTLHVLFNHWRDSHWLQMIIIIIFCVCMKRFCCVWTNRTHTHLTFLHLGDAYKATYSAFQGTHLHSC